MAVVCQQPPTHTARCLFVEFPHLHQFSICDIEMKNIISETKGFKEIFPNPVINLLHQHDIFEVYKKNCFSVFFYNVLKHLFQTDAF